MAAKGYPGDYAKGSVIEGLDEAAQVEGVEIFHAGTKADDGKILANGGRVLNVCGIGNSGRRGAEAGLCGGGPDRLAGRLLPARYRAPCDRARERQGRIQQRPCPTSPTFSPDMNRTGSTPPIGRIFARSGGDGPPLLLLHGYAQSNVMWHKVAPALAQKFTLIMPDLPGYGWSDAPRSGKGHAPYDKRSMARGMIELMEKLGHARFYLAGHDRGGRVSYRLALDNPGRLIKLAVLDIIPTYEMWNAHGPQLRHEGVALDISRAEISDAGNADREGADRISRLQDGELDQGQGPVRLSIRARSRITARSSPIRCASTPPARITAPARPPISATTRSITPRATRSARRCSCCGARPAFRAESGPLAIWKQLGEGRVGQADRFRAFSAGGKSGRDRRRLARILPTLTTMTAIDRQAAFSGTKEVAPALSIDAARLSAYLHGRIRGFRRPADDPRNSAAASRTRPIFWKRPRAAMCCGESRPASCCPPRMRWTANSGSSRRLHAQGFPVPEAVASIAPTTASPAPPSMS